MVAGKKINVLSNLNAADVDCVDPDRYQLRGGGSAMLTSKARKKESFNKFFGNI